MTAAATPGPSQGQSRPSFADATPAEVRAALIPEEAAEFDQQWREVTAAATEALDLSEVLATGGAVDRGERARGAPGHVSPGGRQAGWGRHPG